MAKTIPLHPKRKPPYKYNINAQIALMPYQKGLIQQIVAHLQKSGINRNEFFRDRAIAFGSTKSISADNLAIYAKVFDCSKDDLLNEEVKATSFREKQFGRKSKSLLS